MLLFLLAPIVCWQSAGGAPKLIHHFEGTRPHQLLGASVAGAGDVNADGHADVVAGAPYTDAGQWDGGAIVVWSGADGSVLHTFRGNRNWIYLGRPVAGAGDVDADGFDDILAGVPEARQGALGETGAALVYSGRTGGVLIEVYGLEDSDRFGYSVAGIGDVNADGHDDVLIGAPGTSPQGYRQDGAAYVFSGATGALLRTHPGLLDGDLMGNAVSAAGDVNADGFADYLVAAPHQEVNQLVNAGKIFLYTGADGSVIYAYTGSFAGEALGAVAAAGDVDADGHDDFLIGSYQWGGAAIGAGKAWLYSGATGAALYEFTGARRWQSVGRRVFGPGDMDGDGTRDLGILATMHSSEGVWFETLTIFSGATGLEVFRYGIDEMRYGSTTQAAAGDVDGDGSGDFVLGNFNTFLNGNEDTGSVTVLGLDPFLRASPSSLSVAAGGRVLFDLQFQPAFAGGTYLLLASAGGTGPSRLDGLQIPLTQDRFFWRGYLHGYGPSATAFSGTLDAAARASARLDVAPGLLPPALIGTTLHFAALAEDAAHNARAASIAQRLTLLP